jgi:hypothetical protein
MKFLERLNQMTDEAVKTIDKKMIRLVTLYEKGGAKAIFNALKNEIEKNLDYVNDYVKEQQQRYEDEQEAHAFRNKKQAHDEDINPVMQALDNIICQHRDHKKHTQQTLNEMQEEEVVVVEKLATSAKAETKKTRAKAKPLPQVLRTTFLDYNTEHVLRCITFDEDVNRNNFINEMIRHGMNLSKGDIHQNERRVLLARKTLNHENGLLRTIYLDNDLDDTLRNEALTHKINACNLIDMYINIGIRYRHQPVAQKKPVAKKTTTKKTVAKKVDAKKTTVKAKAVPKKTVKK